MYIYDTYSLSEKQRQNCTRNIYDKLHFFNYSEKVRLAHEKHFSDIKRYSSLMMKFSFQFCINRKTFVFLSFYPGPGSGFKKNKLTDL